MQNFVGTRNLSIELKTRGDKQCDVICVSINKVETWSWEQELQGHPTVFIRVDDLYPIIYPDDTLWGIRTDELFLFSTMF